MRGALIAVVLFVVLALGALVFMRMQGGDSAGGAGDELAVVDIPAEGSPAEDATGAGSTDATTTADASADAAPVEEPDDEPANVDNSANVPPAAPARRPSAAVASAPREPAPAPAPKFVPAPKSFAPAPKPAPVEEEEEMEAPAPAPAPVAKSADPGFLNDDVAEDAGGDDMGGDDMTADAGGDTEEAAPSGGGSDEGSSASFDVASASGNAITKISHSTEDGLTTIKIEVTQGVGQFRVFPLRRRGDTPARVWVDLEETYVGGGSAVPGNGDPIKQITAKPYSGNSAKVARVQVDLAGSNPPNVDWRKEGNALIVTLGGDTRLGRGREFPRRDE